MRSWIHCLLLLLVPNTALAANSRPEFSWPDAGCLRGEGRVTDEVLRDSGGSWSTTAAECLVAPSTAVRTNAQLVQDVATRADAWATRQGLTGTPQQIGIAEHGYAQRLLDRYQSMFGDRGLQTELSVINKAEVPYGTAGSVRLDVLEGDVASPTAIYDYKFGQAGLTQGRINQVQTVTGYQGVPVIEVRP